MSTKPGAKNTTSADVSFSSDSDDDDKSSSSSSSSESSSESDVETTKPKSSTKDPSPAPPPPPSTVETAGNDDVETVSFTLSLSTASNVDELPAKVEEAPNNEMKVELDATTTTRQETTTRTSSAEQRRDSVSPRNSPDVDASDIGDTRKKTSTKKSTKTAAKSSTAEAMNGDEGPDRVADKKGKVTDDKASVEAEPLKKPPPVSDDAVIMQLTPSTAENVVDDEVETVSFTLSLSTVNDVESPTEEVSKKEQKVELETTTKRQETKTRVATVAATEEKRDESMTKLSDAVIKVNENDAGETKTKTSIKKTTKAAAKSSKVDVVNGSEEQDAAPGKSEKAATVTEEKVIVRPKKPASTAEDAENETKTVAKTVKKKTKKVSGESPESTDAAVEEKPATKESVSQNQAATESELTKTPPTNTVDETVNAMSVEAKSAVKSTKKKTSKKVTTTESETLLITEEKGVSLAEEKLTTKETIEEDAVPAVKTEPVEALPSTGCIADTTAANQDLNTADKTTVIKKKTKKARDIGNKSGVTQEDATVPVKNLTNDENFSDALLDETAKSKSSEVAEAETSTTATTKSLRETTGSGADKDTAAVESTTSDKVTVKKKKPKKARATSMPPPPAAESTEPTINDETERNSISNVTPVAAANADLLEKAPQDVTVSAVAENSVAQPAAVTAEAASREESGATDAKKSTSPVVPVIGTNDDAKLTNIVTLIALSGDTGNEGSLQNTSAPVDRSSVSAAATSTENKSELLKPTNTSAAASDVSTDDSAKDSKNEESDYSYRRKSMDDFIKRILAEAREEQQKRMATTTDTANLMDLEPTVNESNNLGASLSPTNKEASMLDRRLASTDRKRTQKEELGEDWRFKTAPEDADLDQDLAEIGRYFAKRNLTGSSRYESEAAEKNGDWNGSRVRDTRQLDVDSVVGKTVIGGQESGRPQQNGLVEESFVPRAREETAELVRNSSRPVRAIIDQQNDVIQLLKTTSRSVDDLESEIRNLRASFLDRQARIDTLHSAVDAEVRAYQADQQAANDRLRQQDIPGGRFVRDEFMRANNILPSNRSSAIDELLEGVSPRRRSGSVSSTSGIVTGAASSGMTSNDLDYESSALNSWVLATRTAAPDQPRRMELDDDASSTASGYSTIRSRRAGSAVRERSYMTEDPIGSRMETSRSYLLPTYDTYSPSGYPFSETLVRSTITYAPPQTSTSTRGYYQTDFDTTTAAAASPHYGGYLGGDSRSYGYSSLSSTASNDPSRFRRAQSVSDFSSERSTVNDRAYNSAFSSPAGQFQSRFLDKVRARKSHGDDQYRSRFLASDSGSSKYNYSSRRNYSSND